ncbi:MAG: CARDB domain-containing protein, partial [Clostridiales bacterium]
MAKKLMMLFMVISMLLVFAIPVAAWEPNMDGGGGAIGGGGGGNVWHNGQDGLRVTFVNKATGYAVTKPVDLTNGNFNGYNVFNFQGADAKNKTYYAKDGGGLNEKHGNYTYWTFGTPIPKVIGSGSDINALRARFQDIGTIQGIVKKFIFEQNNTGGFSRWEDLYDFLANGDYTIMIEPIAYFYFNGNFWAMTATEAALYNTSISNGLHSKMGSLTQCLLPMSVLLSSDQCGYWVDQYVYSQRNNTNFRFSTNYGGYVNGDRQIVANGVGVGFLSNPSENVNQKPDLAVTSFVTDKSNYTPGETVKVTARVQNLGVASNAFTTSLKMTNGRWDGSDAIQVQRKEVSSLSNNSYADYEFYFTAPAEGTYSITITADCYAAIDESNENNNTATANVIVNQKPDLTISSFTTDKSTYNAGDTITVTSTVSNIGAGGSSGEHYVKVEDEPVRYFSSGVNGDGYLRPGGQYSRTYTFTAPSVSSATNITLRTTVDYLNGISESNENNNTKDIVI